MKIIEINQNIFRNRNRFAIQLYLKNCLESFKLIWRLFSDVTRHRGRPAALGSYGSEHICLCVRKETEFASKVYYIFSLSCYFIWYHEFLVSLCFIVLSISSRLTLYHLFSCHLSFDLSWFLSRYLAGDYIRGSVRLLRGQLRFLLKMAAYYPE